MTFHVDSEIGRLRQVVVHRPGIELSRLTPANIGELLFDDVVWVKRAREEHDAFVQVLADRGVLVHRYGDLLTEVLAMDEARRFVLDRVCTDDLLGPSLAGPVRSLLDDAHPDDLAELLVGGVVKADLHPLRAPASLHWEVLSTDDFVLPPLPNHVYQRDNSSWVYGGVAIHPMARSARRRESVHSRAIYRYHPHFAAAPFSVYLEEDDQGGRAATVEGGDVHVIGGGAVLIGMGERTTPAGAELLLTRLFAGGEVTKAIAVELPRSRATLHLDTVLTMVDHGTFVAYPRLEHQLRSWTVVPGDGPKDLCVVANDGLWPALAAALGLDRVTVLRADEDVRAAEREQWDDGTNYLAISPGVVVGYERNVLTNALLHRHGIEVLPVAGSELGRGRGGPRCMTCPIEREPA